MKYKLGLLVILAIALRCECGLSLLGGILSTAHEQVHEVAGAVLGTITKGINLNFESHVGFNQQRRPGYGPPPGSQNEFGPPHNNYGPPNEFGPPHNNYGPPNEFRPPHNNNYGQPNEFGPPNDNYGQGHYGHRPNKHGYQNNNRPHGYNQNEYNPGYNYPNPNEDNIFNQQYGNENQRYPNNPNNNYQGYENNNNGYNNQRYPNQQNYGNDFNNNNNQNRPNFVNKPVNVNPNNGFENNPNSDNKNPENNLIIVNKPVNENPTNNGFGTIYGENSQVFSVPSQQPEFSTTLVTETDKQAEDDKTTEKPKEDAPIFIPLGDYVYTGEAANITAPKRETDRKEETEENFAIDIRFKE